MFFRSATVALPLLNSGQDAARVPGPATFERNAFKSRLFTKGAGSYPLPRHLALVFGGRPDLADFRSNVARLRYHRDDFSDAEARGSEMKNHFEGATPEALAKALLRPVRKPKAKPVRQPQRVVRSVTAKSARAAK